MNMNDVKSSAIYNEKNKQNANMFYSRGFKTHLLAKTFEAIVINCL